MPAIAVIFEGVGPDARTLELAEQTDTRPYGTSRELQTEDDSERAFYAAVQIFDGRLQEAEALDLGLEWLQEHAATIRKLTTYRNLEVQTVLQLSDGSRMFYVRPETMQMLVDLDCTLIHQCMRELDAAELQQDSSDG